MGVEKVKAREKVEKREWERARDAGGRACLGIQCGGEELCARYQAQKGTQLSEAEGARMEWRVRVRRPPPSYLVLKLLAELLSVQAELETKAAALEGKSLDSPRLASVLVLGLLDKSYLAASLEEELCGGRLGQRPPPLSKEEQEALECALAVLPPHAQRPLKAAQKSGGLLSLAALSQLIYTLGFGLEQTDYALQSTLEGLAQTETAVLAEEDTEHYYKLACAMKVEVAGRRINHPLVYGQHLAALHGYVKAGSALLKRVNEATVVKEIPRDHWLSLKVLAILYDVLSHTKEAARRMPARPGLQWQLKSLGAMDRTFMRAEQKHWILQGRRANLNAAELDPLMELSAAARHASIDSHRYISKAAKRIQKHILENYLFSLEELRELFTDLSHRFHIPLPAYKILVDEVVNLDLMSSKDGKAIVAKVRGEEKQNGVLLLNALPLFTEAMGKRVADYEEEVSSEEYSESSSESEEEKLVPKGKDAEVPVLLLHDLVLLKRHGPRRSAFHLEAYKRALAYLETTAGGEAAAGSHRRTAIGYLRSAVSRKRPLPLTELRAIIGLLGTAPVVSATAFRNLLADLRAKALISAATHHNLITQVKCPATPNALRDYFDTAIGEKA